MPIDPFNNSSNTLMSNELQYEEIARIMAGVGMGMWSVEYFEAQSPRMTLNAQMAELFGIKDVSAMSPEEVYDFWLSKVKPEDKDSVMSAIDRMKLGNVEEITCLWGDRYLRFTGSGRVVEGKGQILTGYCSDVSNLLFKEKEQKKAMAQMGAELRRAYEIVQFVSRSCTSIYNINMLTGRYKRVSTELKKVDELLGEEGDVREGLQKLCENIVKPEWKETIILIGCVSN